ncbi:MULTISPECIES: type II secretion system F family protein [unclassified Pseudomonas]|uniref:type II secretion system F family protein n=1 Tax=unclassified Pseudomonas TaxID=196821 RepID=UPI0025F17475|nr:MULTISPECIES: type II secretion system F family protein [unclassified Pseudomonas]
MKGAIILGLVFMLLMGLSFYLFYRGLNQGANERIMSRLSLGRPESAASSPGLARIERAFLRAGLGRPTERLPLALTIWLVTMLVGYVLDEGFGLALGVLLPVILLRLYVSFRYQRRVRRMIEQLPPLLDHAVRSLKSGRTLGDAVLHGIDSAGYPLNEAMSRIKRNVQLGVPLPDAVQDFAELYERDEFQLFAMGLRVNHRYGGNASELLDNLIRLIREREQATRQLKAMTGETRMTSVVLALLPVGMVAYFLIANPSYLLHMWNDDSGRTMLMVAFAMQTLGCLALWRMMRSI